MVNHNPAAQVDQDGVVLPDLMRDDVAMFIRQYIAQNNHQRGPFELRDNATTQLMPGVTVPAWLAMCMNQLASDPRLPYNNDRAAMQRDFLMLACAGVFNMLVEDFPEQRQYQSGAHIIRHEETLRRDLFVEELLLNYTEDLAVQAKVLVLMIETDAKAEIFNALKRFFDHALNAPNDFWRTTILRLMFRCEEVIAAMRHLNTDWYYIANDEFQAWTHLYQDELTRGEN